MSLRLLYVDELKGFARSKVMAALWIGLPVMSVLLRSLRPETEGIPLTMFVAILIASIAGTLSAVMLSASITGERNRNVYELFLIRPVKRRDLILSKYLAALSCLTIAVLLSFALGALIEAVSGNLESGILKASFESLLLSIAGMALACGVGVFFGVLINSVAVSAILSVYLGNQLSALVILPMVLVEKLDTIFYPIALGLLVPIILLVVSVQIFKKKMG